MQSLGEQIANIQREWQAQVAEALKGISSVDWRAAGERTHAAVFRLAELGWTVPSWLTPREAAELAALDSESLDQAFTTVYLKE
jgi:hypothetical protein